MQHFVTFPAFCLVKNHIIRIFGELNMIKTNILNSVSEAP